MNNKTSPSPVSGQAVPNQPLCIIPVRGGSKGIPRKNLIKLNGVSLLEWTIRQALQVYERDQIFVSTEDSELAEVGRKCNIHVLDRPAALAQDSSTTASVVDHLFGEVDPHATIFSRFTILQVTSPLRQAQDVRQAEEKMSTGEYDSVISAFEETQAHPAKMYVMENEYAVSVAPMMEYDRRQDLATIYRRNGAIFSCTRNYYATSGKLWGGKMGLVVMPQRRSVDIDTYKDLEIAQGILSEDCPPGVKFW